MTANEIDQPIESEPPPRLRPSWDAGALLVPVNGVIAAIVGAYMSTRSVLVTAIAGAAALLIAVLIIGKR
ncbi:hypothetical protein [Acrocarpospora sp. B8E8]|uniref:hypothetical protein n=1 Tax=Acrocarpospora sp. B8E8 TaxID=3153572 RepID=UPI00325E04C6